MGQVAYRPKAAYEDPDSLGTVFVNDTTEVNVRELVASSADGVFTVEETPDVIRALDAYPALRRASVAKAQSLDELTKKDLLALPEVQNLEGTSKLTVEELREAVRSAREGSEG